MGSKLSRACWKSAPGESSRKRAASRRKRCAPRRGWPSSHARPSSPGRWGSHSTSTPSTTSKSSSISCCSAAWSANRAPAYARCAVTPTSKATGPWASGRRCRIRGSIALRASSRSTPHEPMAKTPWTRSAPCSPDRCRSSSPWGATSCRQPQIPSGPRKRSVAASSLHTFRRRCTAGTWSRAPRRSSSPA